jgi:DnaK suppressor protein
VAGISGGMTIMDTPPVLNPAAAHNDSLRGLLHGLYLDVCAAHEAALADADTMSRLAGADRAGEDEVDAGTRAAAREEQLTLVASLFERRGQLEYALERLERGEYGRCEHCGTAIPPERLEVYPTATACVQCKQVHERR